VGRGGMNEPDKMRNGMAFKLQITRQAFYVGFPRE